MHFNEQKATAVAAFFLDKASGEEFYLKLMKLMYLAERESILRRNCGITGDRFVSMDNGPVLSKTLRMLTPQEEIDPAKVWREHIGLPTGYKVRLSTPIEVADVLSKGEIDILEETWKQFGDWDRWRLVAYTHSLGEWTDPAGSSVPISFQDILVGLKLPPDQIKSRFAEHRAMETFDGLIENAKAE